MMIKTLRDVLTAYWKEQTKAQIKLRKNKLLIYDEHLNKYVSADELLVPGDIKQEKANGTIRLKIPKEFLLFELLLNKFVNPKLDLLTPGATTNEKQLSAICDFKIKHKNFTRSSIDYFWRKKQDCKEHVPALPPVHESNTEIEEASAGVGWAGQVTKKPLSDPRPEINHSSCSPDGDKGPDKKRPKKKEKDLRKKLVCHKVPSKGSQVNYRKDAATKDISSEEYTGVNNKNNLKLKQNGFQEEICPSTSRTDRGKAENENLLHTKNTRQKSKERKKNVFKKICSQLFSQEKGTGKECLKEKEKSVPSKNTDLSESQTTQPCDNLTISKSCEKTLIPHNENVNISNKKEKHRSKSVSCSYSSNAQMKMEGNKYDIEHEKRVCKENLQSTYERSLSETKTQSVNSQCNEGHSILRSKYNFMVGPKVFKFKGKFLKTLNFSPEKDSDCSKTVSEKCETNEQSKEKGMNSNEICANLYGDYIMQTPKKECTLTNLCTKNENDMNQDTKRLGKIVTEIRAIKKEESKSAKEICKINIPVCKSLVKVNTSDESVCKANKNVLVNTVEKHSSKSQIQVDKKDKSSVKCHQSLPELPKNINCEINYKDRKKSVKGAKSLPEISALSNDKCNNQQKSVSALKYKPKKGLEFGLTKYENLENNICKSKVLQKDTNFTTDEVLSCQHVEPKVTEKLEIMTQEKCFEEASRYSDLSKSKSETYMGFKINKHCSETKQENKISPKSSKTKCTKHSKKTLSSESTSYKQHVNELKISKSNKKCSKDKKSKEHLKSSKSKRSLSKDSTKRMNSREKCDKDRKGTKDTCETHNATDKIQPDLKNIDSSCNKQKKEVLDSNRQPNCIPKQSLNVAENIKQVCDTQHLENEKQYLRESVEPSVIKENQASIQKALSESTCCKINAIGETLESSAKCETLKKKAASEKKETVRSSSANTKLKEDENIKDRLKEKKSLTHASVGEKTRILTDRVTTCAKQNQKHLPNKKSSSNDKIKSKHSKSSKKLKSKTTNLFVITSRPKKRVKSCKSSVKSWKKTAPKQPKKSKSETICSDKKSKNSLKQSKSHLKTHSKNPVNVTNKKSTHSIKHSSNSNLKKVTKSLNKSKLSIQGLKTSGHITAKRAIVCSKSTPDLSKTNKPRKPQSVKSTSIKTNAKVTKKDKPTLVKNNSKGNVKRIFSNKSLKESKSTKICSLKMLHSVTETQGKDLKQIGVKSFSQLKPVSNPQINNLATNIRKTHTGLYDENNIENLIKSKLIKEQKNSLPKSKIGKSSSSKTLTGIKQDQYQELCNISKNKIAPKISSTNLTRLKNLYTVNNSLPGKDEKFNLGKNRNITISSNSAIRTIITGNTKKQDSKFYDPNVSKGNLSNKNNSVLEEKTNIKKETKKSGNKSEPSFDSKSEKHVNEKYKQITLSTVVEKGKVGNKDEEGKNNYSMHAKLILGKIQTNPRKEEVLKKEMNYPTQSLNVNVSKTISNEGLAHTGNEQQGAQDKVKQGNDIPYTVNPKGHNTTSLYLHSVTKGNTESLVTNNMTKTAQSNSTEVHLQPNLVNQETQHHTSPAIKINNSVKQIKKTKKKKISASKKIDNSLSKEKLNTTDKLDKLNSSNLFMNKKNVDSQITQLNSTELYTIGKGHFENSVGKSKDNFNETKNKIIDFTYQKTKEYIINKTSKANISNPAEKKINNFISENTNKNNKTEVSKTLDQSVKRFVTDDKINKAEEEKEEFIHNKTSATHDTPSEQVIKSSVTDKINQAVDKKMNEFIPGKAVEKQTNKTLGQTIKNYVFDKTNKAADKNMKEFNRNTKNQANNPITQISKASNQKVENCIPSKVHRDEDKNVKTFIPNKILKGRGQEVEENVSNKKHTTQISKTSNHKLEDFIRSEVRTGIDKNIKEFIPDKTHKVPYQEVKENVPCKKHTIQITKASNQEVKDFIPIKANKTADQKGTDFAPIKPKERQNITGLNQKVKDFIPDIKSKIADKKLKDVLDKTVETWDIKASHQNVKDDIHNKTHKALNKKVIDSGSDKTSETQKINTSEQKGNVLTHDATSKITTHAVKEADPHNRSKIQPRNLSQKKVKVFIPEITNKVAERTLDEGASDKIIKTRLSKGSLQKAKDFGPDGTSEIQITKVSDKKVNDFVSKMTSKVVSIPHKRSKTLPRKALNQKEKDLIPHKSSKVTGQKIDEVIPGETSITQINAVSDKKVKSEFIPDTTVKVADQNMRSFVLRKRSKTQPRQPLHQKMKDLTPFLKNKVADQKHDGGVSEKMHSNNALLQKVKAFGLDKINETKIIKDSDHKNTNFKPYTSGKVAGQQVDEVIHDKKSKTQIMPVSDQKVSEFIPGMTNKAAGQKVQDFVPHKRVTTQTNKVLNQKENNPISYKSSKVKDQRVDEVFPEKISKVSHKKNKTQIMPLSDQNVIEFTPNMTSNITDEKEKDFDPPEMSKTQTNKTPYQKDKDVIPYKSDKTTGQKMDEVNPDKTSKVPHKRSKTHTSNASLKTETNFICHVRKRTRIIKPAEHKTDTDVNLKQFKNKKGLIKGPGSITQEAARSVKSQITLPVGKRLKRIVKKDFKLKIRNVTKNMIVLDKEKGKTAEASHYNTTLPIKSESNQDITIKKSTSVQSLKSKKSNITNKSNPYKIILKNSQINKTALKNQANSKVKAEAQIKRPASTPNPQSVYKKNSKKSG